ncbi:MAG: hypothetical protein NTW04_04760, partial [Elusimicrobia bacterium]|nr:hypothetical protein [Elusimicrobiota bacterium]
MSQDIQPSKFTACEKRGLYFNISGDQLSIPPSDANFFEDIDLIYRSLCAALYNYVPGSGHPGGSISSGRIVQNLIFETMDYDFSDPDRQDADIISYAAGHKAMGLYAVWALRNELVRIGGGTLAAEKRQIRLEDLLGFRRNPTQGTSLFKKFRVKPLDGHPTCATPFVKVATGASGVGLGSSAGLALAAMDIYPDNPPFVNIIEGEGGMTPGRVHETIASAATIQLKNVILHIDWNQASIDSERVCPENGKPGDYVQWTPAELMRLHDWNVIAVADGHDFSQINAAQKLAKNIPNNQPTAIVYRT